MTTVLIILKEKNTVDIKNVFTKIQKIYICNTCIAPGLESVLLAEHC